MKRLLILATVLLSAAGPLSAGTKVTFVPQWTPQAQFVGYYMALEKGFYAAEGLDVTIDHIGVNSTESVLDQLYNGKAQIVGGQLLQSIVARSDGRPIVNVMQLTQVSGLWCVSHRPVSRPEDLDGMKIGRWKAGYSEFGDIIQAYKGINVEWVPFINGINLYVYGAVDATLCYSYNEYIALCLSVGAIPEANLLKFSDFGYDCPEDGLYVTEKYLETDRGTVDAFVRASKRGWDYVREHREEAVELALRYCRESHVVTNPAHQTMMLDEYLSLQVNPATGLPDYAPVSGKVYDNITSALLYTGYITFKPSYGEMIR